MRSIFGQKKPPPPSINAEDFGKSLKRIFFAAVGLEPGTLSLAVHLSTHYSIPPSLVNEIVYIKNQNIFLS